MANRNNNSLLTSEKFETLTTNDSKFADLFNKASYISDHSRDYLVEGNVGHISMDNNGDIEFITANGISRTKKISFHALSQLSTKIGVPTSYLVKCIEKGKIDLAQNNINSWLKDYKGNFFIRTYKGEKELYGHIRGLLSNKYSVCDTIDALNVLDKNISMNTFKIKGYHLSDERFHARFVDSVKMNVPNEDLFAGFSIDNSDVGRSVLKVQFLVYKQVCTNGLIVTRGSTTLFKQRHMGITMEAFKEELVRNFDLFPKITAEIEESIEKTRNMSLPYSFNYQSENELADLIENIKKATGLPAPQATQVIDLVRSNRYEPNRWGYINALTEVAQELTLEKRLDTEKYAGTLLAA